MAVFGVAPGVHSKTRDAHQRALAKRQRELERQQSAAQPETSRLLDTRPPSPPQAAPRPGRLGTAKQAWGVGEHAVGPAAEAEAKERRRRHTMGPEHARAVAERHARELKARTGHMVQLADEAAQKEARAEQARRQLAAARSAALSSAARGQQEKARAVLARRAAAAAERLSAKAAQSEARHAHEGAAAKPAPPVARGATAGPRYTAMHKACAQGDLEAVKALLEAGASSAAAGKGGHTPLEMAALNGHRAIVLRLLRHCEVPEAEKLRCAKLALRGGHSDVAGLIAPQKLTKVIARTPSQVYAATGMLEPFALRDGFYDASGLAGAGRAPPLQTLAQYTALSPNLAQREVVLVDGSQDEELQGFVSRVVAEIAKLEVPDDTAARVALVQRMINTRLGLAGSDTRSTLEERSRAAMWSLQRQRRSRVVSLGSIRVGVFRHRALLFKYIADSDQVKLPCRLVRGQEHEAGDAWVEVHFADGGEDRWQPIGRPAPRGSDHGTSGMMAEALGGDAVLAAGPTEAEDGRPAEDMDRSTVVSGTSADTHEQAKDALSGMPRPGTTAARKAVAAAAALRPIGRMEAALETCLAHGLSESISDDATWQLLLDAVEDPNVKAEALKAFELPPPTMRLCPLAAELHEDLYLGTVTNMAGLHRGYGGAAWLAEHRRRAPALRVI